MLILNILVFLLGLYYLKLESIKKQKEQLKRLRESPKFIEYENTQR